MSSSTNSGIVTDKKSGERHIPESQRPDGSTRKAIKIRPGYRPPEDVEVYKNRTAEGFRNLGKGGVPGAESLKNDQQGSSSAANKNAKRREARKKAKAAENPGEDAAEKEQEEAPNTQPETAGPEVEREKKARTLKKKLKQARELQSRKDGGQTLLPEQIAKVIKINELIRELEALGFDPDDEPEATKDP